MPRLRLQAYLDGHVIGADLIEQIVEFIKRADRVGAVSYTHLDVYKRQGLQASYADTAAHAANFCADYKRGFVLGYSHRMFEKTGDRQLSAWEAGILTRRYGCLLYTSKFYPARG